MGRGFRADGRGGSVDGPWAVGVGFGGLGPTGAGLVAGLGTTAGLPSLGTPFASCCCRSLCLTHAGLFSSTPREGEGVLTRSPFGMATAGFEGTGGTCRTGGGDWEESESETSCSAWISFLLRMNSGSSSTSSWGDLRLTQGGEVLFLSSLASPVMGGGTLVLRS